MVFVGRRRHHCVRDALLIIANRWKEFSLLHFFSFSVMNTRYLSSRVCVCVYTKNFIFTLKLLSAIAML